jgi:hypothetical protein
MGRERLGLGLNDGAGPGVRAVRVERVETKFGTVELWLWTRKARREGRSSASASASASAVTTVGFGEGRLALAT